jgi:hypothetical protein
MGCVWQSEYAPVTRSSDAGARVRPAARHRKPPRWRRLARAAGPVLLTMFARWRPDAGKVAILARER